MPFAYNLTRREAHYRHETFSAGLRAAGYDVRQGAAQGRPGDVLLLWNRYGHWHDQACRFEAAGGTVIVAENGYIAPGGVSPHSMKDRDVYAIALHGHNGSGWTPDGDASRWDALGVDLQPWRVDDGTGHILVCPNRSFGTPGRIMPPEWADTVRRRLERVTKREVRVRAHPGNSAPEKPLADDLANCWAVVIWHSSAGVWALIAGVPVICMAPFWIAKDAAGSALEQIESPLTPDRLPVMRRLAWAQFSLAEISSGYAFEVLLQREAAAA